MLILDAVVGRSGVGAGFGLGARRTPAAGNQTGRSPDSSPSSQASRLEILMQFLLSVGQFDS